ncbi:MAG: alpha/beta fold hydrolase [Jiangellaceae bacterium]|nr:alpha/beta fold hydrolase [Jiangellaceae bacterium]
MPTVPGAEPFRHDGPPIGVLLCHGLTGSPAALRQWGEYLAAAGLSVDVPLLPGHGTTWQELNTTRWPDWYAAAEQGFQRLRDRCDQVFLGGLSMGGGLALRLAEQHGPAVRGLVLVNPAISTKDWRLIALPVLSRFVPSLAAFSGDIAKPGQDEVAYNRNPLRAVHSMRKLWRHTIADLPRVSQPLLVYRSLQDHVLDDSSVRLIRSRVSSTDLTVVELRNSYHVATLDHDADAIFSGSLHFVRRLSPPPESRS